MVSIILCVAAFAFCYVAGRRSLVAGIITVFTVGYFYGILRANLPETFSHFIFDAAVVGLYVTQLLRTGNREEERRLRLLKLWVILLIAWPAFLFFIPVQDYVVQLVGLRGNAFLLPFILLGARLKAADLKKLALAFAILNVLAFAVAGAEYFLGIERFFPQNKVTELIYISAVDEDYTNPNRNQALRIPSTFTGAHAYAGMMVLTLPLLLGAWLQRGERKGWRRNLLAGAMALSVIGIFMAAVRSPVIILGAILLTVVTSARMRAHAWALMLLMALGVGWVVSSEERLQRFMTLKDVDFVGERIYWSVNDSFLELAVEYPMGNGLGGGGTSMPYFLQGRVVPPLFFMENEYARIVLEQGMLGLCLWVAFIAWALGRSTTHPDDEWLMGRRLFWVTCAMFFATGMIGKGLLTSIPGTALFLLGTGLIAVRQPRRVEEPEPARTPSAPTNSAAAAEAARVWARQLG